MSNYLESKSEELEQTLAKQIELLKKDSEDWLKFGAVVAVGVVIGYGIVKATRKKRVKKDSIRAMEVLEKEGLLNEDIKTRLTSSKQSTFWPNLTQRLLILGLALAKDKIYNMIFVPADEDKEIEKSQ
ncbi:MAG: hypothetical protein Q8S14_00445 [Algoriphagus sp.]|uniref:hypothetical protein n=1 Tax=Algoriphagus sp. TaxID=1872435 RepID=UPI002716D39B|nr:hypothetical protein [Algoriphagus sp.]MDO8965663.1 hypothetical protein [Algoriphagus sp.]MDP2042687.1 hypothetical protein [Algoriphagus sp.]MDP3200500.1 hypothetical protein [Algoriphagus sp.]MDP3470309.1 hypothetical protein [Algoriphagus sp.]